jgi:ribosome-binding ATPase YchF (GTP1/OBG family)
MPVVVLSATLENDIVQIRNEEGEDNAREFMKAYGLEESKLDLVLEECSNLLKL